MAPNIMQHPKFAALEVMTSIDSEPAALILVMAKMDIKN